MASFIVLIEKSKNLPQKSLNSSKNMLSTRQSIEEDIIAFKEKLSKGLSIMQEIESTRTQMEKNAKKIRTVKILLIKLKLQSLIKWINNQGFIQLIV